MAYKRFFADGGDLGVKECWWPSGLSNPGLTASEETSTSVLQLNSELNSANKWNELGNGVSPQPPERNAACTSDLQDQEQINGRCFKPVNVIICYAFMEN